MVKCIVCTKLISYQRLRFEFYAFVENNYRIKKGIYFKEIPKAFNLFIYHCYFIIFLDGAEENRCNYSSPGLMSVDSAIHSWDSNTVDNVNDNATGKIRQIKLIFFFTFTSCIILKFQP